MTVTPIRTKPSDRVLPHSTEAEESLLGAMILSRTALAVGLEQATPADFYRPAHAHIFAAMQALVARHTPVDPVTITEELRNNGLLDTAGGPATIVALQAGTPTTVNAAQYATTVARHARARQLIQAAEHLATQAYAGVDPDEIVDDAKTTIDTIGALGRRTPTYTLHPLDATFRNPPEAPGELVHGLLRRGEILAMAADASIGKSWMMMDLALKLADGHGAFLGKFHIAAPCKVVYWHGETDHFGAYDRWKLLLGDHGTFRPTIIDWHDPLSLNVIDETITQGARRRQTVIADGYQIIEDMVAKEHPDVLILDTWGACFDGDESSKRGVAMILRELQRIATTYNVAIILVHHFGKSDVDTRRDPMHAWRGSTRLGDAAHMRLTVVQHYKATTAKQAGLSDDDARRYADIIFRSRNRKHPPKMSIYWGEDFRWTPWEDPDETKDEQSLERIRRRDAKASANLNLVIDSAQNATDKHGQNTWGFESARHAARVMAVHPYTAKQLVEDAVARGVLTEHDAGRNAISYRLTADYLPPGTQVPLA